MSMAERAENIQSIEEYAASLVAELDELDADLERVQQDVRRKRAGMAARLRALRAAQDPDLVKQYTRVHEAGRRGDLPLDDPDFLQRRLAELNS